MRNVAREYYSLTRQNLKNHENSKTSTRSRPDFQYDGSAIMNQNCQELAVTSCNFFFGATSNTQVVVYGKTRVLVSDEGRLNDP